MAAPSLPPIAQMMDLILGHYRTAAISTAARLRLADHLATGPKTAAELASLSSTNPDSISRLARALASINVFAVEGDRFSLTPLGETIRVNVPGSMGHVAALMTDPVHWGGWSVFLDTVSAGNAQVKKVLGGDVWEFYKKHPEHELGFSNAMSSVSNIAIPAVLAGFDFSSSRTIVDVGGAHGALVASVLKEHKTPKGIVFDQPAVAAEAPKTIRSNFPADVTDRLSWVAGDFFAVGTIPVGDTYLLKHILHDWDDEHSIRILKAIRASMQPDSKLLIVELALPEQPAPSPAFWMDLNMMALVNGRERTASQYEALLQQAGLKTASFKAEPTSPVGLLVAVPV